MHLVLSEYLPHSHPEMFVESGGNDDFDRKAVEQLLLQIRRLRSPHGAVSFGISCEACHLGAKRHAEGKMVRPLFFPASPSLKVQGEKTEVDFGRSVKNLNWICARCHSGHRPRFAAGMATWNSTESSDAMLGSCYSKLTCVHCHDPHEAIGRKWRPTPQQDDAKCLKCHDQFTPAAARIAHTHHPLENEGSRCLNCHMPRVNEGMQDVVRTHMIFSPTRPDMIHANHPNACNLCHVDEPIDWTLKHLKDWYTAEFDATKIAENYPHRAGPVASGWLRSDYEAVRLVAADALARRKADWALPQLVEMLNDPYLLNRQFTRTALEDNYHVRLVDYGYRFYMTADERKEPLAAIRAAVRQGKIASRKTDVPPSPAVKEKASTASDDQLR